MHFSVFGFLVDNPQEKAPRLPVDINDTGIEFVNCIPDSIMILRQSPGFVRVGQTAAGKIVEGVRVDISFGNLSEMNIA